MSRSPCPAPWLASASAPWLVLQHARRLSGLLFLLFAPLPAACSARGAAERGAPAVPAVPSPPAEPPREPPSAASSEPPAAAGPTVVTSSQQADQAAPAAPAVPTIEAAPVPPAEAPWCAPELEVIEGEVCASSPKRPMSGPRTLVIFLHGVVKPDSGWQHAQQRAAARAGATHGFSVLMPRGRRGHGPRGMEDWWTWPTGAAAQAKIEGEVIEGWARARAALEAKAGERFERVWIFGFSNGAYYATDLALRARLASGGAAGRTGDGADGFAVFAGGSGAAYLERAAKQAKVRAPLFVGWGGKDAAHGDQVKLAAMLRRLGWPSKSEAAPRAGHTMVDKHVADAVRFLSNPPPAKRERRAAGRRR
jgi:predicted esterase